MFFLRNLFIVLLSILGGELSADYCLPVCGEVGIGYDYFRGIPDGDWEGNTGGLTTVNIGKEFCLFDEQWGIQIGGSYGVYDWNGNLSAPSSRQSGTQQQAFITTGFSWRTCCESGFNFGLVYDWMWNKNFGIFRLQTNVDQLRFQGGYQFCNRDEFGLWGTLDLHWSERTSQQIPVTFRAISQINLFWKHIFANCSETKLWAGIPSKRSLMFSTGRAGKFILGGSFKTYFTDRLGLEGHASYMHPHSSSGAFKQRLYGANICIELTYAFGDYQCCKKPYLEVGNNSNFFVDTNLNY